MIDKINWQKVGGLVPAIIQDSVTGQVLMLGYMNQAALDMTQSQQIVTFYSRSKQRLWQKGETSQNILKVSSILLDCDQDTLLIQVQPQGPCCHTGASNCFNYKKSFDVLQQLESTIQSRQKNPTGGYTNQLLDSGINRIAQKVGEEATEVIVAALNEEQKLPDEVSDLFYHLLVLLNAKGLALSDCIDVLAKRMLIE